MGAPTLGVISIGRAGSVRRSDDRVHVEHIAIEAFASPAAAVTALFDDYESIGDRVIRMLAEEHRVEGLAEMAAGQMALIPPSTDPPRRVAAGPGRLLLSLTNPTGEATMSIDERARLSLYQRLESVLGAEEADTIDVASAAAGLG